MNTLNNRIGPNQSSQQDITESFSVLSVLDVVRRRKLLLLVPIILCTGYMVRQALNIPVTYQARVLLALDIPQSNNWNPQSTVPGRFSSIQETVRQRSVLEPVIEEFGLYVQPGAPISERHLNRLRQSVIVRTEGARTFHFIFAHTDPEKAAAIVTRVAERFLEAMESRRKDSAAARVEVLGSEVERAEAEMLAKYAAMEAYEDQISGPLGDSLNGYLATVSNTNERLAQNGRSIADLEGQREQYVSEITQLEQFLGYTPTNTSPVISAERRALEFELERALDRYTEQHPEVLRIQSDLARLDDGRINDPAPSARTPTGPSNIDLRLISLRANLSNVQRRLDFLNGERLDLFSVQTQYQEIADSIPEQEETLAALVREHEFARARYGDLLNRLYEARLTASLQPADAASTYTIAEAARIPIHPVNPQRERGVYLGFALGTFIGVALLLLAHQLDTSFTDVQDLSSFAKLPILASIPSMRRRFLSRSKKTPLPTLTDRVSIASEQYRILAVRLRDMIDREFSHVVLFTGAAGGEGKTTTVLNAAIALSQIQDQRVLLIDADLRRPSIRQYLPADAGGLGTEEGLRDLLKDPDAVSAELFGRVGNLYVLAGTTGTTESVDEIVSQDARKLIARLRKTFKYILIDSPPVLPMADSHLLAELADRVVFVVRARRTRRETLARALEVFDPKNLLGLILNDVSYEHARYGQAYRHYEKQYLSKPRPEKARLRIR